MNKTQIEWVRNPDGSQGYTWNPITGCLNHVDGKCKGGGFPCYAYRLANTRLFKRYTANDNYAPVFSDGKGISTDLSDTFDPFYPRFWPERLLSLHTPRKADSPRKGIFVCDMGELFGDWIPQSWQEQVFNAIKASSDYRFYLLTKQPQNLPRWSPFPDNCWVGVTVCTNGMMTLAMQYLSIIEAPVKFISFEPLLGSIGMNDHMKLTDAGVSWAIIGAQTKPYKPPEIAWVKEIVGACDKADVAVFLKDNLRPVLLQEYPFYEREYDQEDVYFKVLVQEMPTR